jgi:preprotein translocase subunit SecE
MNGERRTLMQEWIEKTTRFFKEVRAELAKVIWPPRKGVIGSTAVVIVSVFIVSFFLGLVDVILQRIMSAILR